MDQENVFVLTESDEHNEDTLRLVAVFTGPDAAERVEEVKRLKSMKDDDTYYFTERRKSNPTNEELGLGAPLNKVETDPFVQAAIASIFSGGAATVPAWLNIEWLCAEVHEATKEKIRIDGRVLRLDPPQKWITGMDAPEGRVFGGMYDRSVDNALNGDGFFESDR